MMIFSSMCTLVISGFRRPILFIFTERGREGERKGEKHGCVKEK